MDNEKCMAIASKKARAKAAEVSKGRKKKGGLKKTQTREGPKIGPSGYSGSSSGSARAATPDSSASVISSW